MQVADIAVGVGLVISGLNVENCNSSAMSCCVGTDERGMHVGSPQSAILRKLCNNMMSVVSILFSCIVRYLKRWNFSSSAILSFTRLIVSAS